MLVFFFKRIRQRLSLHSLLHVYRRGGYNDMEQLDLEDQWTKMLHRKTRQPAEQCLVAIRAHAAAGDIADWLRAVSQLPDTRIGYCLACLVEDCDGDCVFEG